jgi:hypothetical protein
VNWRKPIHTTSLSPRPLLANSVNTVLICIWDYCRYI